MLESFKTGKELHKRLQTILGESFKDKELSRSIKTFKVQIYPENIRSTFKEGYISLDEGSVDTERYVYNTTGCLWPEYDGESEDWKYEVLVPHKLF